MQNRILWKVIFAFSLFLSLYTLNQNLSMPIVDGEQSPKLVAYGLLIFDFLILLGSFGYAFKIKMCNALVWKISVVIYPMMILMEMVLDFYAGGYEVYEMVTHTLLSLLLTSLLVAPVYMYLKDFKAVTPQNNSLAQ